MTDEAREVLRWHYMFVYFPTRRGLYGHSSVAEGRAQCHSLGEAEHTFFDYGVEKVVGYVNMVGYEE